MASKPDISRKELLPWDEYQGKAPVDALASIHARVAATATTMCDWYWNSIRTKRSTSLWIRGIAFLLLVLGTSLPIFAAIQAEAEVRLLFTQWGVALLVIAGLMLAADRVFGWSSGWMRYITTVTTMENLTRAFELEWAKYLVSKDAALERSDVKALFEVAKNLEQELTKLQTDETTTWVAEFNSGISLLESLIKSQREETGKKLDAIRTSLSTQEAATRAEERARQHGAVEVTLKHKAEPKEIHISLDEPTMDKFVGHVWSRLNVTPGQHRLLIQTVSDPPQKIEKVIEVQPSGVSRQEVQFAL